MNTSITRYLKQLTGIMLLKTANILNAQPAQMPEVPYGAYPQYFTYYNPSNPNNPVGSDWVSKGIVGLSVPVKQSGATGFFIRTFRDDHKICFCTAGHPLKVNNYPMPTPGEYFSLDMYFDHRGEMFLSASNLMRNRAISGFLSSVNAELKAYYYSPLPDDIPDAALLLVDEDMLPVGTYATLGYSFDNDADYAYSELYTIGHPVGYPQRIVDSIIVTSKSPSYLYFTTLSTYGQYFTNGISGAPIIKKATAGGTVTGIFTHGNFDPTPHFFPYFPFDPRMQYFTYSRSGIGTRFSILQDAIKQHCWQNQTIDRSDYGQTVLLDNRHNLGEFYTYSTLDVTAFNDMLNHFDQQYTSNNVGYYLLKGQTLNISSNVSATDAGNKKILVRAPDINLIDGFSYTASNDDMMDMHSVVLQPMPSSSSFVETIKDGGTDKAAYANRVPLWDTLNKATSGNNPFAVLPGEGFGVRPNPSSEGIFYIATPKNFSRENYSVEIHDMAGRPIKFKKKILQDQLIIDLTNTNPGSFVLTIKQNGHDVYKSILIYNN